MIMHTRCPSSSYSRSLITCVLRARSRRYDELLGADGLREFNRLFVLGFLALQANAKQSPLLRSGCIGLGRKLHSLKFRVNDLLAAEFKLKKIKPLEEDAALARGSTFLGESFIFTVAAAVVSISVSVGGAASSGASAARNAI